MLSNQKTIFFFLLNLWTAVANAQWRVWRADTRTPNEMRAAGLFAPRGASHILQVMPNVSMYNHARGAPNGASRDNDGYVSTTASEATAVRFLRDMFGGTGYIYEVAAAANFIQVAGTLGQFNPYSDEHEYAALGGFSWDQVIRWTHYTNGQPDRDGPQANSDYEGRIYNRLRPTNGVPALAGFPATHRAWGIPPWNAFAQGPGCGGNIPRSLDSRQEDEPCTPKEDNMKAARRWIDANCFAQDICG